MTLVDTDILIWHLRGNGGATAFLRTAARRGPLYVSALTITEVEGGMRSGERTAVGRAFEAFEVLPVTLEIARRAGEHRRTYRRSHANVGLVDCVIGATAEIRELALATLNVKHFPMLRGLKPPFDL